MKKGRGKERQVVMAKAKKKKKALALDKATVFSGIRACIGDRDFELQVAAAVRTILDREVKKKEWHLIEAAIQDLDEWLEREEQGPGAAGSTEETKKRLQAIIADLGGAP
jgi:hypothetical protein